MKKLMVELEKRLDKKWLREHILNLFQTFVEGVENGYLELVK